MLLVQLWLYNCNMMPQPRAPPSGTSSMSPWITAVHLQLRQPASIGSLKKDFADGT